MKKLIATLNGIQDNTPFGTEVEGIDLVILKQKEKVNVFYGKCPHQQALLAEGQVEGGRLICHMHGWQFDHETGKRIAGNECLHKFTPLIDGTEVYLDQDEINQWKATHLPKESASKTKSIKSLPHPKGLPFLGNLHQFNFAQMHQDLELLSDELGPLFRIDLAGKEIVVSTSISFNQQLLKNRPKLIRRSKKLSDIINESGVEGVFTAEGDDWQKQRKVTARALNIHHLKTFFPTLTLVTQRLKGQMDLMISENRPIDIHALSVRYTVDITTNLAFGYDMNTIEETGDVIQAHMEVIFPTIFRRLNSPFPYWRYMKLPADRSYEKSIQEVTKTINQFISQAKQKLKANPELRTSPGNFLEAMLVEQEAEDKFTDKEILGNVFTMLLAGEDTTANSIAWAMYFLGMHPEVQEKLHLEAKQVLKEDHLLQNYEDAALLTYTEAVALETLRLKSVAPMLYLDTLEEIEIEGLIIPKGTTLITHNQHSALQSENFTHPKDFVPERWLPNGCPMHTQHNPEASIPFGAGSRFCPGRSLALLEIKVILSMFCKNYHIELKSNPKEVKEQLEFTMLPTNLDVSFTLRKDIPIPETDKAKREK
ncbi:cytochrome P450 [Limibacter armeniacum]|uniref:cytochrome P450 n=1 Tax=Limibacter armeniacum TaxID=466084 RepID=UPI002FE536F0